MGDLAQDFDQYDALGLADLVRRKEVKPIELVEIAIERIERVNPTLNCVIIKTYDLARKLAESPLPQGPFTGVPLLLKDIGLMYAGVKTTSASRFYKDFVAQEDSLVVQFLKQAGFILVGKTNLPENGFNITTEPVLYNPTLNPWNLDRVPGGSSGGAGAAVAARILPLADGSDGGGSIRIPASNNGLVGLKPSRGRVSWAPQAGDVWYGMATTNCLSLTVRDSAAYLDVIGRPATGDIYQLAQPEVSFLDNVGIDPGKLKIGVITKSPLGQPIDPACVEAVESAVKLCAELGHEVVETEFSFEADLYHENMLRLLCVLSAKDLETGEAMIGRQATEGDLEPANWEAAQRGKTVPGVQHAKDIEALRQYGRRIAEDCQPFDIVLTPTQSLRPQPLGAYDTNLGLDTLHQKTGPGTIFTNPFNASGQPAVSLPLFWSEDGLPIGVQFAAKYANEALLFRLAGQLEKARPWIDRRPPVCA
ncbi:MAG: amidase [Deltaproteobacteria bacterium]|nr:amidase [Deltaproteobacteria bacterium]